MKPKKKAEAWRKISNSHFLKKMEDLINPQFELAFAYHKGTGLPSEMITQFEENDIIIPENVVDYDYLIHNQPIGGPASLEDYETLHYFNLRGGLGEGGSVYSNFKIYGYEFQQTTYPFGGTKFSYYMWEWK